MKKKISTFLKVMAILQLIGSVLSILVALLAFLLLGAAGEGSPSSSIGTLVIGLILSVVNVVMCVMALKDKQLTVVYIVTLFTAIMNTGMSIAGGGNFFGAITGLIIPILFVIAVILQIQAEKKESK